MGRDQGTGELMSMEDVPLALPAAAVADAKAYLRVEQDGEDALLGGLMASAARLCEQFSRRALLERTFRETISASTSWTRLSATPARTIMTVEAAPPDGPAAPLASDAYAIDIDANGDGWVRLLQQSEGRIRVTYEAGMAADWSDVPEALRQGIVRLAAHFYAHRDAAEDAGPPAVVTALWRPWRRMRLG